MISLIGLRMFLWSSIAIFGIVPLVIIHSGFENIIFFQKEMGAFTPLVNAMVIFGAISLASYLFRERRRNFNVSQLRFSNAVFVAILLLLWCALFLLGDGLSYRQNDVTFGTASRNTLLRVAVITSGAAMVGSTYLFLARGQAKAFQRVLLDITIFSYLGLLAGSGSRGLVLAALISMFIGKLLKERARNTVSERTKNSEILVVLFYKVANFGKVTILASLALTTIAIWGATRDNYESVSFSLLFRLSEPYWHFSFIAWQNMGADPSLFLDAIHRIGSIPLRWFGFQFPGSVDGTEYFLEAYLGIQHIDGVSLPLTLLGHGLLAGGYIGVFLNFFLVATLFILLNRFLIRSLPYFPCIIMSLLAYQISKTVMIYPKTLSGAFLYLGYELLRDMFIVFFIASITEILSRATQKKPNRSA